MKDDFANDFAGDPTSDSTTQMTQSKPDLDRLLAVFKALPFDLSQPVDKLRARMDRFAKLYQGPAEVKAETTQLGGVNAEKLTADPTGPVVLFLHGGGYVTGSSQSHRHLTSLLAKEIKGVVFALDYRLAPEAPFPAALDDASAAWAALAGRYSPGRCAIVGDSAGGGLSFAVALQAREAAQPMPACLVGLSPWVNLGTENPSYDRLAKVDLLLSRAAIDYYVPKYAPDHRLRDPLISPLFADLRGLPATLIQVGDHECFFGDAVAMHETLIGAGVASELTVWNRMFHVWHLHWPALDDGRAALEQAARFVTQNCAR